MRRGVDRQSRVNGASPSRTVQRSAWRRGLIDLALLVALGSFMAVVGPYGTLRAPPLIRTAYWLIAIAGGGAIGIGIDLLLGPRIGGFWMRILAVTLAMTLPVSLLVILLNHELFGDPPRLTNVWLPWQVFVISLLVMTMRALAWRRAPPVIETRTLVVPPLPEAEAAFRLRLSARRRSARLIAIEAEDHFVRVHTDAGSELLSMRFAEALDELARAHGYRTHRSWWVAADAIEAVRWNRGVGEARLVSGQTVPVSRTHGPALKDAGWR